MKKSPWDNHKIVNYYSNQRSKFSELYNSEKKLLKKISFKKKKISILDFGCATVDVFIKFLTKNLEI